MLAWEQGESTLAEGWLLEAASGLDPERSRRPGGAGGRSPSWGRSTVPMVGPLKPSRWAAWRFLGDRLTPRASGRPGPRWRWEKPTAHGAPAGLARLAERLPQPAEAVAAADTDLLIVRGTLGFYAGRIAAGIADLRVAIRLARQGAAAAQLPRAHLQLAQLLLSFGDWDDAMVHADLALSLVSDQQRIWMEAQAHAALGRLFADRGQWALATEHVAAANTAAATLGNRGGGLHRSDRRRRRGPGGG